MLQEERMYVRSVEVGFYHPITRDPASDLDLEVDFNCGGDVLIPVLPETLCRLIVARHAAGQYTPLQIWRWLIGPDAYEPLAERFFEDTGIQVAAFPTPDELEVLHTWLLDRHAQNDVLPEWDEAIDEAAVDLALAYFPDWLEANIDSGGSLTGADFGSIKLPADRTLSDVIAHMEGVIEQELAALEPTLPDP